MGVWIPRVDRTGVLDLRVELHHGGVRLHQHGQFTSGRTLDGRILGMGGPDTNAGFVELTADDGGRRLSIELGVEDRSADRWRVRLREGGGIDVWEKAEDLPDELRLRALVKLTSFGRGGREIGIGLGFERVSDHGFQKSVLRHNALVEVAVRAPLLIGG